MSSFRNIKITCPACNTEGDYTVWDSVNVDLDPELRKKVMSGSIFSWVCPNCGKKYEVPYSFLYHDMTHSFMIQFDAERSHIIPFAAFIRVKENGLDINVIEYIAASYRDSHPQKNILFDELTNEKQLCFSILEMPEETWVFTEKKHVVTFDEYTSAMLVVNQRNATTGPNAEHQDV